MDLLVCPGLLTGQVMVPDARKRECLSPDECRLRLRKGRQIKQPVPEVITTILANRYRVLKRLGKGGMGSVYLARDRKLNMLWAVKELGDSDRFMSHARKAEISVLRKVSHPNLPRVTDIFDEGKKTWMVMDYVEGKTLEEILSSSKRIPQKKFYRWSIEITSALQYLHSMNPPVIYRDMKPSNIIIRPSGSAVLIDFGTAKSYESKSDEFALGTKSYAAPEQFKGQSDERSDIYSLGKVMEKMAGNRAELPARIIFGKCTQSDPDKRFPSAEAVKTALFVARDIYKAGAVLLAVCLLVFFSVFQSRTTAKSAVRDVEEITENSRQSGLYDNALMCFYELKDYDSALSYFEELDEDQIPEAKWYKRLCRCLLSPESTREEVLLAVRGFKEFNDRELLRTDMKRKLKNDTDIARIYLMYSGDDAGLLKEALNILLGVDSEYERENGAGTGRINVTALLLSAYKSLGQVENRKENYLRAVKCGDRLKELLKDDPDEVIKRYLDNARLFEELSMFRKAEEEYTECERLYPGGSGEIYTGHLRLLLKRGAPEEQIRALYKEAGKVKGIGENREFRKISERTGYEQ